MKVFANKIKHGFAGGMILVAADSVEEAIKTFHTDKNFDYMHDYIGDEKDLDLVRDYYYFPEDWYEVTAISANVDRPCVLEESHYIE